ncbi:pseudouridine synthase [Marinobacterium sp. AK62]|uniref:Pseudouridine synthase n=1 Tax=Marinobacterium alkalitolerans TaxID=1542925 RepID=A0ABS3Z6N7_9GAMM|nr:pseudouridine synthase [Marinobacterium alkalitolerans]MBP0047375.1 pseudouridine synthase [Marinobacterium alkalitolerans]
MRLDRFICKHTAFSHKTSRTLVATGQVQVNSLCTTDPRQQINQFDQVLLNGQLLQGSTPLYWMLNKPPGYLSATEDPVHPTVLELMPAELRTQLHLAGRLDRATTGLMLLTNDGRWSRRVTAPETRIPKTYRVRTATPIATEAESRFKEGIWLQREGVYTSPASIERLSDTECRLTIYEGRHHQVKRMFAAVGNEVTALHRERIGRVTLDSALEPGDSRPLTQDEVQAFMP